MEMILWRFGCQPVLSTQVGQARDGGWDGQQTPDEARLVTPTAWWLRILVDNISMGDRVSEVILGAVTFSMVIHVWSPAMLWQSTRARQVGQAPEGMINKPPIRLGLACESHSAVAENIGRQYLNGRSRGRLAIQWRFMDEVLRCFGGQSMLSRLAKPEGMINKSPIRLGLRFPHGQEGWSEALGLIEGVKSCDEEAVQQLAVHYQLFGCDSQLTKAARRNNLGVVHAGWED
ncbi:hypothetical protein RHGRI_007547 [Rhododendron griersonianum]|uniref:Uncharacterized protein n=1 Tax=Rhododendron griersonianum TaxID=479676 RepID=A0AAV6KYM8_9ERIC|nr:hypothetical protein RHGRI_007547 [Rhododendron griersonianum]